MFDIFRQYPRRTLIVMLAVAAIASIYLAITVRFTMEQNDGHIGALLDDTWIHVRFAEHLSEGQGLAYNEGELTSGATSLLWVLTLAIPFTIFDPGIFSQVDIAIAMSAVGYVLTALAITAFGWWATRRAWIGFAAGLITALTGRYIWMGLTGMEITTFTTLCILSIWSHMQDIRDRRSLGWRTGILLALTTLARPEAYLLTALVGLDAVIFVPLRDETTRQARNQRILGSWRGIIAYSLLAGSYPLANLLIDGYPLPNTFRAKSQLGNETPDLPRAFFWMANVDHGAFFIVLAGIGTLYILWLTWRRKGTSITWALWPSVFILGVLFLGAERYVVNHSRYIAPSIPFNALAAVVGVWAISRLRWTSLMWLRQYLLPIGLVGILAVVTFARGEKNVHQVANDVKQLRRMHVQAGYWFDATTQPDEAIALNDVGAMVHISDRRVIDLEGLVYPEVIEATNDTADYTCEHDLQLARVMLKDPPRFIGVFPWFYPCLTEWPGALQPETIFTIRGPTVLAGGELVIYYPVWENWPMLGSLPPEITLSGARFADSIELAAYNFQVVENGLEVTLWWQAHGQPDEDYHVFVHLVDQRGHLVTLPDTSGALQTLQHDSQPQERGYHYFPTSWWRDGDIIRDTHIIQWDDLSIFTQPGYQINVGLYRFPSGERLVVRDGPLPDQDHVTIPLALNIRRWG
ncbi:MAG: hypothetical protein GYB66_13940 [Chloroflexi bacterium]|nr:hypothetical protein [Chloroflexota bacterium]